MKTTLTIEQSAELIKRRVTLNENDSKVFDIGDLLSLLPKTINPGRYYLDLSYGFGDWTASYILWDDCDEGTYIRDT